MKAPALNPDCEVVAERLMERLSDFVHGIGIHPAHARAIIGHAIADEPSAPVDDIEAKARIWMLNAAG